jgi:hypothetical protein
MKRAFILSFLLLPALASFSQKKVTTDTTTRARDTRITPGASGVKRSIGYRFSTVVSDADPGAGTFRFNKNTISQVSWLYVDNIDIAAEDQSKWYSTWDDTTGATGRGSINIVEKEGKNVIVFNITGVFIRAQGYWKMPVEYISGTLPANGTACYFVFNRITHSKPKPQEGQNPSTQPVVVPQPQTYPQPQVQPQQQPEPQVQPQPEPQVQPQPQPQPQQQPQPQVQPQPEPQGQPQAQPVQTRDTRQTTRAADTRRPAQTTQTVPATQTAPVTQTAPAGQAQQAKPGVQTTEPAQHAQPAQANPQYYPTPQQPPVQQYQNDQPPVYNQVSRVNRPADISNPYANADMSGVRGRKWYRGIIELGYALGIGEYGVSNFRFNFINGFMIGRSSSIGLGIGYRRYFEKDISDMKLYSPKSQVPVFLDLRTSFSTRKVTPYLALGIGGSAGYLKVSADSTLTTKEGFYLCPSGGIWFNVSDRFAVFAGLAYELQRLEYILLSDNSHFKKNAGSLSLNIGIAF